jgi:hypothetical protein
MGGLGRWLLTLWRGLLNALLYLLSFGWLRESIDLVRELIGIGRRRKGLDDHRRRRDPRCIEKRCGGITPDIYRRPDPMIYSQGYLLEQGLAVTWDNPDIQLYRNGVPVSSSSLEAGTQYEIRAQIWNNSTDAPAVGLDADFFFHDFGIGTAPITIGQDTVTLPIKGAPGHPATARSMWTTPNTPGHYCLKVQLNWGDDANPRNNLGQENTDVGTASSPAVFRFPVRNESTVRRALRLVADAYAIPEPLDCKARPNKKSTDREHPDLVLATAFIPPLERDADWTLARLRHGPHAHPVPAGWFVQLEPDSLDLDAGETGDVEVSVTPPDGFVGERTINVNAMHGTDLVGGVTLLVRAGSGG